MLALFTLTTTSTTSKLLNYSELGEGNDQELRGNCQITDLKSVVNAVCSRTGLLKSQDVLPVVDVF